MKSGRATPIGALPCLILLAGCASLGYPVEPPLSGAPHGGFHYLPEVSPVNQAAYQCGPAALESVIRYWGQEAEALEIGRRLYTPGTRGVLNFTLAQYASERGFWTEIPEADFEDLKTWIRRGIPPVVMLHVGPFWLPTYHFIVLKGFNDPERIFYVNTGQPETRAIPYPRFKKRWGDADRWTLIFCPPERVDWELEADQAAELAFLLERKGRLDLAERWYRSALAKKPASVPARFNLANVYLSGGRLKEARILYQELLKENPAHGPSANNWAWIELQEGRPQEAVRVIEQAFRSGAERQYDILDTAGLAYGRLKRTRQARDCFLEALSKVPSEKPETRKLIQTHLDGCPPVP